MKVKVCGMTQLEQIYGVEKAGADYVGFIFYRASPRYVLNHLSTFDIRDLNVDIQRIGVFVNEDENEVLRIADECDLDMVQLHGDETPSYCANISNHYPVVKTFRMLKDDNILWKVNKYANVSDYFLFDTKTVQFGGSGEKFDWSTLLDIDMPNPYFLSGGIGVDDAEAINSFAEEIVSKKLIAVDINSKFELSPGNKDVRQVERFIVDLKSYKK